jgi:uncharacterized coiled-coil DUF342 family protein
MNDGTIPKGIRDEWSLLLHSFLDEQADQSEMIAKLKSAEMSVDQIKVIKKELSSKRKKMNQSIESIKIKIDQVSMVIENLELVGSATAGLQKEIEFLSNEGEKISEEVVLIGNQISKLHELQENLTSI